MQYDDSETQWDIMTLILHCLTLHIVKFPVQRRCRSGIEGFDAFNMQISIIISNTKHHTPIPFVMLLFLISFIM